MHLATAIFAGLLGPCLAGISPASVSRTADPGMSFTIDKHVTTPEIPPKPDIVLLIDVTGSMFDEIADVRTNLAGVISTVTSLQPEARFAVAYFRDVLQSPPFKVLEDLTADLTALQNAVNSLTASAGGDLAEDWINALWQVSSGGQISFREDSSKVVVLIGDAPSHDPSVGHTIDDAIAGLTLKNIRVIGVNAGPPGLDADNEDGESNQATDVVTATDGTLVYTSSADEVADAIVSGLKNLDATVSASVSCDAGLTAELDPTTATVSSGSEVTLSETITVADDAVQGATLGCSVGFLINDEPGGDGFIQTVTVSVADITPPTASCVKGPNPAGHLEPDKNANFWTLQADDNVDADVGILVRDSDSDAEFGPYPSGTNIKLVQAPGAEPDVKPGRGEVDWQIRVKGCAVLVARDAAGNQATVNCCARP